MMNTIPITRAVMEPAVRLSSRGACGRLGASVLEQGCSFLLWAPSAARAELYVLAPREERIQMDRIGDGYHHVVSEHLLPGTLYRYRLDGGEEYPDPASRFQPDGVHGPSEVVADAFEWSDGGWFGLPLERYVIYELHVGTYTHEGTFDALIPHLDYLRDLGITAIELMPVAQFPGARNWGYDGVYPFAVQASYGGPHGLKRLVNAAHEKGLALILDVVYNHLGPEGNYLGKFGDYFTDKYRTAWGSAVNFDGPLSNEVRRFFIENALYWITDFHIDALRLDAVHAIFDHSPRHILQDLSDAVRAEGERLNRRTYVLAESDANDVRLVRPVEAGGMGMDAQWNDEFHHALHVLLTHEHDGYYEDFDLTGPGDLAKVFAEGYVYTGQFSRYRRRPHGAPSRDIPAGRFIVSSQNHDQVGNRPAGERLSELVSLDALKLAAGAVLLSPFVPLLFAGEEYGETAPFLYFVSHSDPLLIDAVRRGRRSEFAAFDWRGELPDPQDEAAFRRSRLDHSLQHRARHAVLLKFYKELIRLRAELPALRTTGRKTMHVATQVDPCVLSIRRPNGEDQTLAVFHFGNHRAAVECVATPGLWTRVLDSAAEEWLGSGSAVPATTNSNGKVRLVLAPASFYLLRRTEDD